MESHDASHEYDGTYRGAFESRAFGQMHKLTAANLQSSEEW